MTALKRVGKSQREISKALRRSNSAICNYLQSPNEYGTRKPTGRPEKLSPQFKRKIVHEVKKENVVSIKNIEISSDASCSTRIIRKHLNNEKIKHKKRIHHPRLTMKYNEKRLEYMLVNIKPWVLKNGEKLFSRMKRNSISTVPIAFRSTGTQKDFRRELFNKV